MRLSCDVALAMADCAAAFACVVAFANWLNWFSSIFHHACAAAVLAFASGGGVSLDPDSKGGASVDEPWDGLGDVSFGGSRGVS